MLAGHYISSLVAKRIAPELSLGTLFIAAQLVDIFWGMFILTGIEYFRIVPGFTASNPLDLYYMPYTHSLAASILWGLGFAALSLLLVKRWRQVKLFWVLAAVVVSHWLLDLLVHVPDLPLWGNRWKQGFGLWHHRELTIFLELGLLGLSTFYLSRSPALKPHSKGLWGLFSLLTLIQLATTYGPIPQSTREIAITGFVAYWLLALIAHMVERRNFVRPKQ